jgi:CDP-paratose 2-epimerase
MKVLITGGAGFLGSNLSAAVLAKSWELVVFDNLSRLGSAQNLKWLEGLGSFNFTNGDIRDKDVVENLVMNFKPNMIFHLAGQVAMTTSINDPGMDFAVNVIGSFNLLDAVRKHSMSSVVIYSSTNKVYGDLERYSYLETPSRYECIDYPYGFDENVPLDFHSPYGCSKGSADQYMIDFSRIYGLKTVVFRHSSMYGGRQYATYDQGWIGWFCKQAIEIKSLGLHKSIEILGNGKQVRDVLYVDDLISLYFLAAENINSIKGEAFNIGGGFDNSLSLLELISTLTKILDFNFDITCLNARQSDQKVFVADIRKIKNAIGWVPAVGNLEGLNKMLEWTNLSE